MKCSHTTKSRLSCCFLPIGLFFCVTLTAISAVPRESYQTGKWTTPQIISTSAISETVRSWFPDLAIDEYGTVHMIWCLTSSLPDYQNMERVAYTRLTNSSWSQPNDIVPPSPDIVRNAITTDLNGHVLMLYGGSVHNKNFALYFTQANLNDAWSGQAWSPSIQVNLNQSYMGDIAVDSHGVIHVIYDDMVSYTGQQKGRNYSDIYYRKSTDGGKNWSTPANLSNSPQTGSARPYMEIDSNDTIHVTWDEGWDRLTGVEANSQYSVYTYSKDGGESWSVPKMIDYPNGSTEQLTVGSTGKGGVMLVWRSKLDQNLYYQWSSDGGVTWSVMPTIHNMSARPWTIPFDMYDMASDSNGTIHLVVVGQPSDKDTIPGVYHLIWDGVRWSKPEKIFWQDNLYPEYPKIVISEGNQIHTAWFTREGGVWNSTIHHVWYSRGQADAPFVAIIPPPTPTTPAITLTPTLYPSATPQPTISSEGIGINSPTKEYEYLRVLAIVLSPVALLLGVIFLIKLTRLYNRL